MKNNKVFSKVTNPHTKPNKATSKTPLNQSELEQKSVNDHSQKIQEKEIKSKSTIEDKNTYSRELLQQGYIDAYIDYYYLSSQKTPNVKPKYQTEEEQNRTNNQVEYFEYSLEGLKIFKELLEKAESYQRSGNISAAITKYLEVKDLCFQKDKKDVPNDKKDLVNALYFNEKCINLAKNFDILDLQIESLISMGSCFDGTTNSSDLLLSVKFKEQAKELFEKVGNFSDTKIAANIYNELMNVYKLLAAQEESQNNYEKSIEYLQKQLENIRNLEGCEKEKNERNKELEKEKMEVYIKIASLYFKLKDYEQCIYFLEELYRDNPLIADDNFFNSCKMNGYLLYAETKETLDKYDEAINYLKMIEPNDLTSLSPEDSLTYTKSLLHLGRLYFLKENNRLSHENLYRFFKESKKLDAKELLDLSRVNLGMIKGTMGMDNFIRSIQEQTFLKFLDLKLKYYPDSN